MKKKTTDIKSRSYTRCSSHKCNACGEKLYTGKWWHSVITIVCMFSFFGGFMSLAYWLENKIEYAPVCYSENMISTGNEMDRVVYEKSYYDCDDFNSN